MLVEDIQRGENDDSNSDSDTSPKQAGLFNSAGAFGAATKDKNSKKQGKFETAENDAPKIDEDDVL